MYVPAVERIKVDILRKYHDSKTAGHLEQEKTLELLTQNPGQGWQSVGPCRVYVPGPIRPTDLVIRILSSPTQYHEIQVGLKFGATPMQFGEEKADTIDRVSGGLLEIYLRFNGEMGNRAI